ncbi:MAG: GGDEF domain-containing protein [Nitrospirae bacterium]|nr:GGDEF domain-containing protein [Nitrospirota bacterium]
MRIERFERKIIGYIKKEPGSRSSVIWVAYSILLITALGIIEYLTGNKLRMSYFYLLPVGLVALRAGKLYGYMLSVISGVTMETVGLFAEKQSLFSVVSCLNILLVSMLFLSFVLLVCALQKAYCNEVRTSRLDNLTGLMNVKSFSEVLIKEIERCRRFKHPFSMAYIGCDNFRIANEKLEGSSGDGILRLVAECMRSTLRSTDVVARVHNAEFAMLLTESDNTAAKLAMGKLESRLKEIITQHYPELKFSIGIVSFTKCPYSFKEVLDMAEMAMHECMLCAPAL